MSRREAGTPEAGSGFRVAEPLAIASRNPGKVAEFARLLAGINCRMVQLGDLGFEHDLVEPGTSYRENALAKAVAVATATGVAALGDDSGIEVIALGGWPGAASARWLGGAASDRDRLDGLLTRVASECSDDPRVRYVAELALVRPGAAPVTTRGECEGVLVVPRGSGGFGYDPGFLPTGLDGTFGELPAAAKDLISHRSRALTELVRSGALEWR